MKTAVVAAALVASVTAYSASDMPACWSSCFSQYGLEDEECLCDNSTGKAIFGCISSGCDSSEAAAYASWLQSYCAASSSSAPVAPESSAPPAYSSSAVVSSAVPSGSWAPPAYSSAVVSSAAVSSAVASSAAPAYSASSEAAASAYPSKPAGPIIVTSTTTVAAECSAPAYTSGQAYTTTVTESVTVIPHAKSYSWGDWTSQYTSYETSTCTGEFTVTSTYGSAAPSGPASIPATLSSYSFPAPQKTCATGTASAGWPAPTANSTACTPCKGQGSGPYCGLTLQDDWYEVAPITCKTVTYDFTITQGTVNPDGVERMAFLVNNQFPGPMIKASWGDTVVVKVTNSLPPSVLNGTSIHFHGIRQNGTNEYDGVSSITQCPLAPGDTMTYTWQATSYGSSWWHAHLGLQTYEGIFGPVVIDGPSALDYDDEQVLLLQDWNHATVDSIFDNSQVVVPGQQGGPIVLDTGLINGMNVWEGSGKYFSMSVTAGKTYRLRIVNTAIQSTFKFHIDGHSFQVMAMDFVPIHPYTTDIVSINIGQRYDLIMKADATPGNYWIRSDNQQPCGQLIQPNIQGVLSYDSVTAGTPTSTGLNYPPDCLDEPSASLVPILAQNVGAQSGGEFVETSVIAADGQNPNLYKWTLSGSTFMAQWGDPTLYNIWNDGTFPQYGGQLTINLPNLGEWVYFVIDSPMPLPHPIHLHGHDFFVLASGVGAYSDDVPLNMNNPPRRDVAVMPADPTTGSGGYLVIAYQTSNPGVWLLHCHIGWHNTMGFALQIIENLESIEVEDSCQMLGVCQNWHAYANQYDVFNAPFDDGV